MRRHHLTLVATANTLVFTGAAYKGAEFFHKSIQTIWDSIPRPPKKQHSSHRDNDDEEENEDGCDNKKRSDGRDDDGCRRTSTPGSQSTQSHASSTSSTSYTSTSSTSYTSTSGTIPTPTTPYRQSTTTNGHPSPTSSSLQGGNGAGGPDAQARLIGGLGGGLGGLILLILLFLAWYFFVLRRRRRQRLGAQYVGPSKVVDIESRVTVGVTNAPQTPRGGPHSPGSSGGPYSPGSGGGGSSDVLSSHAAVPPVADSSPPLPPPPPGAAAAAAAVFAAASYPGGSHPSARHLPMVPPSAGAGQASLADAYAASRSAYGGGGGGGGGGGAAHSPPYSPTGSPQAPMPPVFPPRGSGGGGTYSPLRSETSLARPDLDPMAMEIDSRPPPPRYPGTVATSCDPPGGPASPLPVSPLSAVSAHSDALSDVQLMTVEPYQGPRQPSYDYQPSALPEVVSPIYQLGQTSASSPEYDESAEAARLGVNSQNFASHYQGDEKQALSAQQPMPRY